MTKVTDETIADLAVDLTFDLWGTVVDRFFPDEQDFFMSDGVAGPVYTAVVEGVKALLREKGVEVE